MLFPFPNSVSSLSPSTCFPLFRLLLLPRRRRSRPPRHRCRRRCCLFALLPHPAGWSAVRLFGWSAGWFGVACVLAALFGWAHEVAGWESSLPLFFARIHPLTHTQTHTLTLTQMCVCAEG
ncbi:unnamed protein product [Protopolystoma xenopodis]|uniref:Uncharacterized protein n=1 Tax=Protopolystoma xenopodis TaxID=117903 RepID=A0A448XML1_9PLAT|nr:unnamed protein product [Protopolystoma xenopodis]